MDAIQSFLKFILALPLFLCALVVYIGMILMYLVVCALLGAARVISPAMQEMSFKDLEF